MSLILHLSDIHLAPVKDDSIYDDYKNEFIPLAERNQRSALLRNTLSAFGAALRNKKRELDAIVITGDISVANSEDGFRLLSELIAQLKGSAPPNEQIVVIPGNHDVTWFTSPGSHARYKNFVNCVRPENYITPCLDGIDFPNEGDFAVPSEGHYLLGPNNKWLVIPINSANYSGCLEPIDPISEAEWTDLPNKLSSEDKGEIKEALERLRLHDAARISPQQFRVLETLLNDIRTKVNDEGGDFDNITKIALLHHHLLPVSASEEVKSFESIINLGHLRYFLSQNNFDLVLHGHKHTRHVYWDHIYNDRLADSGARKILVVSGATIGGRASNKDDDVFRVLDLDGLGKAPTISIASVPLVQPGLPLNFDSLEFKRFLLWDQDEKADAQPIFISGETAEEVYDRVLSLFRESEEFLSLYNVVCQVTNPGSANSLPENYPEINKVEDRQKWFDESVAWWQKQTSNLKKPIHFTHGERIYAYKAHIDQFERIVEILDNKDNSQRAVVALLEPETDDIRKRRKKFPSFCLLQFVIRTRADQTSYLDCIGYFRKQEFRYWLPVNLAELAVLQKKVFDRLKNKHQGLRLGTITSIAAIGVVGSTAPRVAIPTIDRTFDNDSEVLWSLAYALFWSEMPEREEARQKWDQLLDDIVPDSEFNEDGIPIALDGIDFLCKQIGRFSRYDTAHIGKPIVENLRQLYELNDKFSEDISSGVTPDKYYDWKREVERLVGAIRESLRSIFEIRPQ